MFLVFDHVIITEKKLGGRVSKAEVLARRELELRLVEQIEAIIPNSAIQELLESHGYKVQNVRTCVRDPFRDEARLVSGGPKMHAMAIRRGAPQQFAMCAVKTGKHYLTSQIENVTCKLCLKKIAKRLFAEWSVPAKRT